MRGYDIYKRAMLLLGYEASMQNSEFERLFEVIFKQVAADLGISEINSAADELTDCDNARLDAAIYGTAMLISASHGDYERNRVFTDIYNAKRAAALKETAEIRDILPQAEVCGQ